MRNIFSLAACFVLAGMMMVPVVGYAESTKEAGDKFWLIDLWESVRDSFSSISNRMEGSLEMEDATLLDAQLVPTNVVTIPASGSSGTSTVANRHPILTEVRVLRGGRAGDESKLRVKSWDPDGDTYDIIVDWGDSTSSMNMIMVTSTGAAGSVRTYDFSHIYNYAGNYNVTVKLRDYFVPDGEPITEKGGSAETRLVLKIEQPVSGIRARILPDSFTGDGKPHLVNAYGEHANLMAVELVAVGEPQELISFTLNAKPNASGKFTERDVEFFNMYTDLDVFYPRESGLFWTADGMTCKENVCSNTFQATPGVTPPLILSTPGKSVVLRITKGYGKLGKAVLGNNFTLSLSNIVTKGLKSGAKYTAENTPTMKGGVFLTPFNKSSFIEVLQEVPSTFHEGPGQIVGNFLLGNVETKIRLDRLTLKATGKMPSEMVYELRLTPVRIDAGMPIPVGDSRLLAKDTVKSGVLFGQAFTVPAESRTIGGYPSNGTSQMWLFTIHTTAPSNNNNSFTLSLNSINSGRYSIHEADLGHSGNGDTDKEDWITGLYLTEPFTMNTVRFGVGAVE